MNAFAPWQDLRARSDELNLGGIAVEGPGAAIVRDAIARLYARIRDLEAEREPTSRLYRRIRELEAKNAELEHHLNPPPRIVVADELGPDLELYNLADPSCEGCGGLGRVTVAVEVDDRLDGPMIRTERVACSCTGTTGR